MSWHILHARPHADRETGGPSARQPRADVKSVRPFAAEVGVWHRVPDSSQRFLGRWRWLEGTVAFTGHDCSLLGYTHILLPLHMETNMQSGNDTHDIKLGNTLSCNW